MKNCGIRGTGFPTITDTDYIPQSYFIDGSSPPDASAALSSTNTTEVRTFASDADEDVFITWNVPRDFFGTTIDYRVITFIHNAAGPSSKGVAFFMSGASLGDGDILSATKGTAVESNWTGTHVQYDRVATSWATVTVTNITAGETAILWLYRDVSDATDNYEQLIGVAGVEIRYTRALSIA